MSAGDVISKPKVATNNPASSARFIALQVSSRASNAAANLGSAYRDGLQADFFWPGNVLTVDQGLYGAWEIGAFVYPR